MYVRTRCNHGWCAHVYAYYFEKDVAVQWVGDAGGHTHDWEHIVVFVQQQPNGGGEIPRLVAVSKHHGYVTLPLSPARVRWADDFHGSGLNGTHAKVVYHKDGGGTHCFRFARPKDDHVENDTGEWFRGALVDWETGFPGDTREMLKAHDFGRATLAMRNEETFRINLDKARGRYGLPGFDSGDDE